MGLKFEWKIERVVDKDGRYREITAVPITRLISFVQSSTALQGLLGKTKLQLNVFFEINSEEYAPICNEVKHLTTEIFKLSSLNIEEFELSRYQEIFNKIIEVNKILGSDEEKKSPSNKKGVTLQEFVAKTVSSLVSTQLAGNLREALDIADSLPYDQLDAFLNARLLQIDPGIEKRQEKEAENEELLDALQKDFLEGTFFSGLGGSGERKFKAESSSESSEDS